MQFRGTKRTARWDFKGKYSYLPLMLKDAFGGTLGKQSQDWLQMECQGERLGKQSQEVPLPMQRGLPSPLALRSPSKKYLIVPHHRLKLRRNVGQGVGEAGCSKPNRRPEVQMRT